MSRPESQGPDAVRQSALRRSARAEAARLFLLVAIPLLGLAVTGDYFSIARYFHGDEAVYYTMAQSIGHDGDLRYDRHDLERIFEEFNQGPQGIVLKGQHHQDGSERVFYAKPFLYSAIVAPLVRFLKTHGALLGGTVFWLISVAIATVWLTRAGFAWPMLCAIVGMGASASYLYAFWMQPELMNFCLVLIAYFIWRFPRDNAASPWPPVVAAAILGAVTFSKIPTGVLVAPILGTLLLRRQWRALILAGLAFVVSTAGLFALNLRETGEWNYQGGDRSIFYFARRFPYQQPGRDPYFRPAAPGAPIATPPAKTVKQADEPEANAAAEAIVPATPKASGSGWSFREAWAIYRVEPSMLWSNLRSFWIGRYSGHLLYFPWLVIVLVLTFWRRPSLEDALTWICTAGAMLCFLVLAQDNYFGGSGTVGNRYFSMMLPPLLFTLRPPSRGWLQASLIAAVLVCGQFVLYPFMTLFNSGEHASRAPFRWFPIERSLVNSISIPNRNYFKLPFDEGRLLAYLPDAGTYGWEEPGFFWTRGDGDAEVILRVPFEPIQDVLLTLEAGFEPVEVDVWGDSTAGSIRVPAGSRAEVPLHFDSAYLHSSFYGGKSFIYRLKIRTKGGFVPASAGRGDSRYLGARVRLTADPLALASAYFARSRYVEADAAAARVLPGNPKASLIRLRASRELGDAASAVRFGEEALSLGAPRQEILPQLGLAALEAGDTLKAKAYALELSSLEPSWAWPVTLAARAEKASGNPHAANTLLQQARALHPARSTASGPRGSAGPLGFPDPAAGDWRPCSLELGGIVEIDRCFVAWDGNTMRGRLLGRALRRPPHPVRLFVHLAAATELPVGLFRALSSDLWSAVRRERLSTQIELASLPVPPELWMTGDELSLEFEMAVPPDFGGGLRELWLALGLLDVATLERLPVSSPDLWVIRRRAFLPLTAESRGE